MLFGKQRRQVKRILIVEDEPLVAFDNEQMVASAGYEVVATTDNVADALARMSEDVDLVLTDISLAGERSGVDLAREARKLGVPVLFSTATPPEGGEGLAIGVLLKPYNERRLRSALKAVEDRLAGKDKAKAPEGLILYPPPAAD